MGLSCRPYGEMKSFFATAIKAEKKEKKALSKREQKEATSKKK